MRWYYDDFDEFFNRMLKAGGYDLIEGPSNKVSNKVRCPVSDIRETETSVLAAIELPGVRKEDIKLQVTDTYVEVKVDTKIEANDENSFSRLSRSFFRRLPIPTEVDAKKAEASFENGILRVSIPKKQAESNTWDVDIK